MAWQIGQTYSPAAFFVYVYVICLAVLEPGVASIFSRACGDGSGNRNGSDAITTAYRNGYYVLRSNTPPLKSRILWSNISHRDSLSRPVPLPRCSGRNTVYRTSFHIPSTKSVRIPPLHERSPSFRGRTRIYSYTLRLSETSVGTMDTVSHHRSRAFF